METNTYYFCLYISCGCKYSLLRAADLSLISCSPLRPGAREAGTESGCLLLFVPRGSVTQRSTTEAGPVRLERPFLPRRSQTSQNNLTSLPDLPHFICCLFITLGSDGSFSSIKILVYSWQILWTVGLQLSKMIHANAARRIVQILSLRVWKQRKRMCINKTKGLTHREIKIKNHPQQIPTPEEEKNKFKNKHEGLWRYRSAYCPALSLNVMMIEEAAH